MVEHFYQIIDCTSKDKGNSMASEPFAQFSNLGSL